VNLHPEPLYDELKLSQVLQWIELTAAPIKDGFAKVWALKGPRHLRLRDRFEERVLTDSSAKRQILVKRFTPIGSEPHFEVTRLLIIASDVVLVYQIFDRRDTFVNVGVRLS